MTISVDWPNKIIESDASILDLPAFHATLRDLEDDAAGAIHPVTHRWKALDLGGGAFFYQADLINGYALKFIGTGPFQISGNLKGSIIDTGVQVERTTSAAFSTTAVGGSGPRLRASPPRLTPSSPRALPLSRQLSGTKRYDHRTRAHEGLERAGGRPRGAGASAGSHARHRNRR